MGNKQIRSNLRDEVMALAFLAATLGILTSGLVNPYLTTPFTPLFATLYLSMRQIINKQV